jgi:hypothetical protein
VSFAQVLFAFIAIMFVVMITARPLDDNDGAEIVMKIEKINEQLPGNYHSEVSCRSCIEFMLNFDLGVQAKLNGDDTSNNDTKPRKQQRNYPVYYVTSKVNCKFGKSVRAFTSQEFIDKYPVKY